MDIYNAPIHTLDPETLGVVLDKALSNLDTERGRLVAACVPFHIGKALSVDASNREEILSAMVARFPLHGANVDAQDVWDALFTTRRSRGRYWLRSKYNAPVNDASREQQAAEYLLGRYALHKGRRGHGVFASFMDVYKARDLSAAEKDALDNAALLLAGGSVPGRAWARAMGAQ